MILESFIALIWAAAGVAFYGGTHMLSDALAASGQSGVVYEISYGMLGNIGGILAVVGVVICPITSGDTAFRSARLVLAEWAGLDQKKMRNRLILTIPLLSIAGILTTIDFNVVWRYTSLANQALAAVTLWVCTFYLIRKGKYRYGSLITALPAAFMTAVVVTYLCMAEEGFGLSANIGYPIGYLAAAVMIVYYVLKLRQRNTADPDFLTN